MAPISRETFKQYCLRKLGKPVIEINVDDDQLEDRIDEALSYYYDYHMDSTEHYYYKHQITQTDIDNKYIDMPDGVIGAVRIFPVSSLGSYGTDMFNVRYQIALNELYNLTSVSMVPYYLAMQHLSLIHELLVGEQPIRYTKHSNRLYVDMDWSRVTIGEYLIVEAIKILDPTDYSTIWSDRWLQNYASAKIQEQWGLNLIKFNGISMPGGVQFNGQTILDNAQKEIEKLEDKMKSSYSLPPQDFLG